MQVHQQELSVPIDYATPRYILRQAAEASGFPLNTLRSFYARGQFRIVGGEAKKGRGLAAELTLCDVMCIAVAKVAIDAGVNAAAAFEAGMKFAYSSPLPGRLPSQLFKQGITLLVCQPAIGTSRIVESSVDQSLSDVFGDFDYIDPVAQVVVALNGVHARVIAALGADA